MISKSFSSLNIGLFFILSLSGTELMAQTEVNYSEAKVPDYELPDPLYPNQKASVKDSEAWFTQRRPEIVQLFETHVYGEVPEGTVQTHFETIGEWEDALDGKATMKQVTATFSNSLGSRKMHMLIFIPNDQSTPVPAFIGLNFYGNQTIHPDPRIAITEAWVNNCEPCGTANHKATEASRGFRVSRWPVERIIDRGYALMTIYYGDIDPDYDDGFQNGIHPLFYDEDQQKPDSSEWGSIAAWAWGLSRAMDYVETEQAIDNRKVAVIGHSRLGKAALWAGATDERFDLVISNESGCGGAALSRRRFGETVAVINTSFPHWFNDNFTKYDDNEAALPVDQHMLMALIAPRPVYVASAMEDQWADPRGEYLSLVHASPVYEFLGKEGLSGKMPVVNNPVMSKGMGYHMRSGGHDLTAYDWELFMDFADQVFSDD